MEDTEKQNKKQNYDWLKGYQFVKGQSGNPGGRAKGKMLKTFAREYLESLPDDEKVNYLATLPAEIVWKMAEGNPETKSDIKVTSNETNVTDEELAIAKEILARRNQTNIGSNTTSAGSVSESMGGEAQD